MALFVKQTARCIFSRNINLLRTISVQQKSFHVFQQKATPNFPQVRKSKNLIKYTQELCHMF